MAPPSPSLRVAVVVAAEMFGRPMASDWAEHWAKSADCAVAAAGRHLIDVAFAVSAVSDAIVVVVAGVVDGVVAVVAAVGAGDVAAAVVVVAVVVSEAVVATCALVDVVSTDWPFLIARVMRVH